MHTSRQDVHTNYLFIHMTELILKKGGYPLVLDDIESLQKQSQDLVKIVTSWCGDAILQGCHIKSSGNKVEYKSGMISYKGKIYSVAGGVIEKQKGLLYWVFDKSIDEMRIYEDGQAKYTREVYTATLVCSEQAPSSAHVIAKLPRLGLHIAQSQRRISYESANKLVDILSLQEIGANNALMTIKLKKGEHRIDVPFQGITQEGLVDAVGEAPISGGGLRNSANYRIYVQNSSIYIVPLSEEYTKGSLVSLSTDIYVTIPLYISYYTISNPYDTPEFLPVTNY